VSRECLGSVASRSSSRDEFAYLGPTSAHLGQSRRISSLRRGCVAASREVVGHAPLREARHVHLLAKVERRRVVLDCPLLACARHGSSRSENAAGAEEAIAAGKRRAPISPPTVVGGGQIG